MASANYTALIQAVYDLNVDMVAMLMARGADPHLKNKCGLFALYLRVMACGDVS